MVHTVRIHQGALVAQALVVCGIAAVASCGGGDDFTATPGADASIDGAGGVTPEGGTGGAQEAGVGGQDAAAGKAGSGGAEQGGSGGSAGGEQDAATDPIDEPQPTVQGKVVDPYLQPVNGVKVRISGNEATTSSDGTFSLPKPPGEYDVQLVVQEAGTTFGTQFRKLKRLDPVLQMSALSPRAPKAAKLSGAIMWPAGTGRDGIVFGDFDVGVPGGPDSKAIVWPTYDNFDIQWYGGATPFPTTLRSLTWTKEDGGPLPQHYTGYQEAPMQLTSGGSAIWDTVPAATGLTDSSLKVGLTPPDANYNVIAKSVFLRFKQGRVAPRIIYDMSGDVWSSTYAVPQLAEMEYAACGAIRPKYTLNPLTNFSVVCKTGLAPSATVDMVIAAPPKISAPPGGQSGVNLLTNLTWAPFADAVYVVLVYANSLWFTVVTSDTTTTLPDLQALGVPLPSQTSFTYIVYAFAPFANVDEAAGTRAYMSASTAYADARAPAADSIAAVSEAQGFKTQ
jgi:hypothetical protein